MRLAQLHLSEERCQECDRLLKAGDISAHDKKCRKCRLRLRKKRNQTESEEQNKRDREAAAETNLFFVSQQMPDRGHDQKRGTAGWVMGEPSPGRSF